MASEHTKQSAAKPDDGWDEPRRPFERFDFDKLAPPRADDPPYRPWWVVSDSQGH